jgi:hypothetical protein
MLMFLLPQHCSRVSNPKYHHSQVTFGVKKGVLVVNYFIFDPHFSCGPFAVKFITHCRNDPVR